MLTVLLAGIAGITGCSGGGSTGTPPPAITVSISSKITSIVAGAAAVSFSASVQNDSKNAGVTWTLTVGGTACSPACGALSAATTSTVTYTPPAHAPSSPNNAPTLVAQAVSDATKSDSDAFTISAPAISVTIVNKFTTIQAGTIPAVTLTAQVQNDPSNLGVSWTLTAGGVPCSPVCGSLGGPSLTSVAFSPPAVAPASPNNAPTITATSRTDPTKSDTDSFTITPSTAISVTITNKITSIFYGASPVTLTAQVQNDPSNAGVVWSLPPVPQCWPAECGTLSGATKTSVIYTPPSSPSPFSVSLAITATSVADSRRSDDDLVGLESSTTTVTIFYKVNTVKAGGSPVTFTATDYGDPTNSGVTWGLSWTGGATCTAAICGTLTAATPTTVVYTPPAATLPSSNNAVNTVKVTATSIHDPTKSDFDSIGVISGTVASCSGMPTGHEDTMFGQYAFFVQGEQVMAGSFNADGIGHFNAIAPLPGGATANGTMDINAGGSPQSIALAGSDPIPGYTLGPDPSGAGDVGCLMLAGSDGSYRILRFTAGQVIPGNGGFVTKGRIIEYDDQTGGAGIPSRVSGVILLQDPTAFSSADTSKLQTNFAFGLSGDLGSLGSVAGSFVLNPATGAITNGNFDSVEAGVTGAVVQSNVQGTGSITAVSPLTGRALLTFTPGGSSFWLGQHTQTQAAMYIVNANEFFLISLDQPINGGTVPVQPWLYAGRAITSGTGFSSNSLNGSYIYRATGYTSINGAQSPQVGLGLLNFNTGNLTGKMFQYGPTAGATSTSVANETYTVDSTTGRVTLTGTGLTKPPVFYLATPGTGTEPIEAFATGTDSSGISSTFGLLEPGATANTTAASLAGNYFLGSESLDAFTASAVYRVGVMSISSAGALGGTESGSSGPPNFLTQTPVSGTLTIDNASGPGTGNAGPNTIAITNGTKLFLLNEAPATPASLIVAEHQ